MKLKLILILTVLILMVGCNFFGGGDEPVPVETPTLVIEEDLPAEAPPTPQVSPSATPSTTQSVSLFEDEPPPDEQAVSFAPADTSAPLPVDLIRLPRHNTTRYSFEPVSGWEVIELDNDTHLLKQIGDEAMLGGLNHLSPYIYLRYTNPPPNTALDLIVNDMRSTLAGVEVAFDPAIPLIDGLRGWGQFVEGQTNLGTYRAYLVAFPLQGGVLQAIYFGSKEDWESIGAALNIPLQSLRWPRL